MNILYIIVLTLGSTITLFILTKIMGYRQMSQMSMFDYINGITIGSIAAEMATALETDWRLPFTAMIIYALVATLLSYASIKSMAARRIITGKSLILMNHGIIYEKNLVKGKIDLSELLLQCRISGYFNLSDLQTIILEANGHLSFLPKSDKRPIQPSDLQLMPPTDYMVANIIIDGQIMESNLTHAGKNIQWLQKQMKSQNIHSAADVLLATCDLQNTVNFYLKSKQPLPKDVLD